MHGAKNMGAEVGGKAGDGEALVMFAARSLAIRRLGDLERHHRPLLGHTQDMAAMGLPAEFGQNLRLHVDSMCAQKAETLTGDARIGVGQAADHPSYAGGDDGFGAGGVLP